MMIRGLKDPRISTMATISEVKLSKDLKNAKIYVQVIGDAKDRAETVVGLASATGFIRRELRSRLSLRSVPELTFHGDDTAEKADNLMGLLADIKRQDEKRAGLTPDAELADDDANEALDDE